MKVKIYRICKDNPLPTQANPNDAGWDVYAAEDVEFLQSQVKLVSLGIIAQAPKGFHFKLCIRSSLSKTFSLANGVGIVDSRYCGPEDEMKIMLRAPSIINHPPLVIKKGSRVGQLILEKNYDIEWDEQENRDFGGESRGGFGSSGK